MTDRAPTHAEEVDANLRKRMAARLAALNLGKTPPPELINDCMTVFCPLRSMVRRYGADVVSVAYSLVDMPHG